MKLCLVGCGRWGMAYLRTIKSIPSMSIEWIVLNNSIPRLKENYKYSFDLDELLSKKKVSKELLLPPHLILILIYLLFA